MLDYGVHYRTELPHPGTRDPSYRFFSDSVPSKTNALAVTPCFRMLTSPLEGLSDSNKTRQPFAYAAAYSRQRAFVRHSHLPIILKAKKLQQSITVSVKPHSLTSGTMQPSIAYCRVNIARIIIRISSRVSFDSRGMRTWSLMAHRLCIAIEERKFSPFAGAKD